MGNISVMMTFKNDLNDDDDTYMIRPHQLIQFLRVLPTHVFFFDEKHPIPTIKRPIHTIKRPIFMKS